MYLIIPTTVTLVCILFCTAISTSPINFIFYAYYYYITTLLLTAADKFSKQKTVHDCKVMVHCI